MTPPLDPDERAALRAASGFPCEVDHTDARGGLHLCDLDAGHDGEHMCDRRRGADVGQGNYVCAATWGHGR